MYQDGHSVTRLVVALASECVDFFCGPELISVCASCLIDHSKVPLVLVQLRYEFFTEVVACIFVDDSVVELFGFFRY